MPKGVLFHVARTGVAEVAEAAVGPATIAEGRATSHASAPTGVAEVVGRTLRVPQTCKPLGTAAIPGATALE